MSPSEVITRKIVERYAHPSRTAYLYLFWLRPEADRAPLIPLVESVIAAWLDEGAGLHSAVPDHALMRAQAAAGTRATRPATPDERRLQMARSVTITLVQDTPEQVTVDLLSRALAFTPKGDRRALEIWRPAEGSWYSAPVGREQA